MLKKSLLVVAAVAMLACAAQAGEIKLHVWPCKYVPQDFMTIPVKMTVGYWIQVNPQNQVINLTQSATDVHKYAGCVTFTVKANFHATLSLSIAPVLVGSPAAAIGSFTADFGGTIDTVGIATQDIIMGTNSVTVCARLTNANLGLVTGGTQNIQVATVSIQVVPA